MKTDNFTFIGQLLELPSAAPRCGDIKVAVGHRFAVQTVVEGGPPGTGPITILVPCPDLMGDRFMEAGALYRVEAALELPDSGSYTVFNDNRSGRLFWAVTIIKT